MRYICSALILVFAAWTYMPAANAHDDDLSIKLAAIGLPKQEQPRMSVPAAGSDEDHNCACYASKGDGKLSTHGCTTPKNCREIGGSCNGNC
jgi:hypothetical protein